MIHIVSRFVQWEILYIREDVLEQYLLNIKMFECLIDKIHGGLNLC